MSPLVIRALRALLVVLGTGALGVGVLVTLLAATRIDGSDAGPRGIVYAVGVVGALACLEAALLALWVLLSMVRRGAIFSERAFRWVDVISVAGGIAAVQVAALLAHAGEIDDAPGLVLIAGGVAVAGAAFALLMVVMRGLLRNATVLRRELDEVV